MFRRRGIGTEVVELVAKCRPNKPLLLADVRWRLWRNLMRTSSMLLVVLASVALAFVGCSDSSVTAPDEFLLLPAPIVSTGQSFACALTIDGDAYCWGQNHSGQLGDGTRQDRSVPVRVATGLKFKTIAAGSATTCALTAGGRAACWGHEPGFRSTDPLEDDRLEPYFVDTDVRFTGISVGYANVCAVSEDSVVYCWGDNIFDTLGDGVTEVSTTPVPVAGAIRFATVNTSSYLTCGLSVAGTAFCWGGSLVGSGVHSIGKVPTPVAQNFEFEVFESGYADYCGVVQRDEVYCWAASQFGPPSGDGQLVGNGFIAMSSGADLPCGLTPDGRVSCWDVEFNSRLTDTIPAILHANSYSTPPFSQLSHGEGNTCGVAATGASGGGIYCWGRNESGQLGNGTTTASDSPVKVLMPRR